MVDIHESINSAMTELGISPESENSTPEQVTETENTEVESEVNGEEVKASQEDNQEGTTLEGEETNEVAPTEVVAEEPKLTAKEFQEIQAAREQLELKEKQITERFAAQEKEFQEKYHEKLKVHDEMDSFLAQVHDNDPDLFDLIQGSFKEFKRQFSNPVFDELRRETQSLRQELNGFKEKASDEVTRTKLDAEINQVKSSLGKDAEAAGVKIDWTKVEDTWADNPKLNIEGAVYALYGANIMKATASKAKVEAVTKKVEGRPTVTTAGSVNRSSAPSIAKVPSDAFGAVKHFAKQLTGKSY